MRSRLAVCAAFAMAAVLLGGAPSAQAQTSADPRVGPAHAEPEPDPFGGGNFRIQCGVSHHVADDPIVRPGQPGGSHLHAFSGNTAVDAYSTAESLRTTGGGTCHGGTLNRSGYWIPSLYDAQSELLPLAPWHVYYKNGAIDPTRIQPMPAGLRIVAGDARAEEAQPLETIRWACGATPISRSEDFSSTIPSCEPGDIVIAMVMFPQCWNGVDLDSPDHSSHMAYSVHIGEPWHVCPASHPVPLPQITVNLHQPVDARGSAGWRLSSDPATGDTGGLTMHADWFDGWDRGIVETFVTHCINARLDCNGGTLGDGRALRWLDEGTGEVRVTEPRDVPATPAAPAFCTVGEVVRVAGGTRVATALAAADAWERAEDVVIATAGAFPDALAGGALAARRGAPLLLTPGNALPAEVADTVRRLDPRRVTLLGGTAALSTGVEEALRAAAPDATVDRVAGRNRYETAAAIARLAGPGADGAVVLASGAGFADAVAAGALTALPAGPPVVLTTPADLHPAARDALEELGATRVVAVGGAGVLGEGVAAAVRAGGRPVTRLSGPDRVATSAAVVRAAVESRAPQAVVLATGGAFPDALAASALAARLGGVVALVPSHADALPPSLSDALLRVRQGADEGGLCAVVLGGRAAVSDATHTAAAQVLLP